jgi:hypothetical protein
MQYVEFSGGDMDQDDDSMRLPDPNADKANAQHGRSIENLLASKNKRLQQDLTELRVNNEELGQMNDDLTDRLFSVQSDLARLKTLNEKLENDLMRVDNAGGKSVFGGGAGSQWGGGSAWNGGFPSPSAGGDGEGSDAGSVGGGIATPAKSRGLAGLDLGGRKLTVSLKSPFAVTFFSPLDRFHLTILHWLGLACTIKHQRWWIVNSRGRSWGEQRQFALAHRDQPAGSIPSAKLGARRGKSRIVPSSSGSTC